MTPISESPPKPAATLPHLGGQVGAKLGAQGKLAFTLTGKTACISDCGKYRYSLKRTWDAGKPVVAWIMLNPSTADAEQDDPTIRRCISFSKAWGYGGLAVLNLFAWRATDPRSLPLAADTAIGNKNDSFIKIITVGRRVVCAWGSHGVRFNRGADVVRELTRLGDRELVCLGMTANGQPRHPLYIAAATSLIPFASRPLPAAHSAGGGA